MKRLLLILCSMAVLACCLCLAAVPPSSPLTLQQPEFPALSNGILGVTNGQPTSFQTLSAASLSGGTVFTLTISGDAPFTVTPGATLTISGGGGTSVTLSGGVLTFTSSSLNGLNIVATTGTLSLGTGTLSLTSGTFNAGTGGSFTGAGTYASGGFTGTLVANDTFDLIGTAQTITGAKTFTQQVTLTGSSGQFAISLSGGLAYWGNFTQPANNLFGFSKTGAVLQEWDLSGNSTMSGGLTITSASGLTIPSGGVSSLTVSAQGAITTSRSTVATLPSATTSAGFSGSPGVIITVTDSAVTMSSTTVGTTPSGGGSNKVLLFSNGAAFVIP